MKKYFLLLFGMMLCLSSLSCGYTTSSSLSSNLKTVYVENFNDKDENIQFKAAQSLDLISAKKVANVNSSRKEFIGAWKKQAMIEARTIK